MGMMEETWNYSTLSPIDSGFTSFTDFPVWNSSEMDLKNQSNSSLNPDFITDIVNNHTINGEETKQQKGNVRIADYYTGPVYMTIGGLGIVSNFIVILVILKSKVMRQKLTNIFILHQSIVDAVVAFFLLLTTPTTKQTYNLEGILGDVICKIWMTSLPLWSSVLTSTYNLVALTLERYLEICHPLWHKVSFTYNKAMIVIASTWLLGLIHQLPTHLSTAGVVDGKCRVLTFWISDEAHNLFGVFNFVVRYLIPLTIMMVSYGAMIRALRRQVVVPVDHNVGTSHASKHQERMAKARQNIFRTLLVVTIAFALCWTLNQLLFFMFTFGFKLDFGSWWYNLSVVLVNVNCCINPFIYAAKYEAFQKSAKALFCRGGAVVAPSSELPRIEINPKNVYTTTAMSKTTKISFLNAKS